MMKAIAVRQPFAWLIVNGYKDIENRTWATSYRGPVLIHASQKPHADLDTVVAYCDREKIPLPEFVPGGAIVGVATIVDCVTESTSRWFSGPYGFVLADARPLLPLDCNGKLGIFESGLKLEDFDET